MGMRVAAPHQRSSILEDLHVANRRKARQLPVLLRPDVDHTTDFRFLHAGDREIVPGRETDDPAEPRFRLGDDQTVRLAPAGGRARYERRIVVVEDEGMPVLRVTRPTGTGVSGTEVAGWVVRRLCLSRTRLFPSLPGAITPVRRHEDPLPRQGVEAPVRIVFQVEHRSLGPATGAVTGWNGSIYQKRI